MGGEAPQLRRRSKDVLREIKEHPDTVITHQFLADATMCDIRTIRRQVNRLRALGLVTVKGGRGRPCRYAVNMEVAKQFLD